MKVPGYVHQLAIQQIRQNFQAMAEDQDQDQQDSTSYPPFFSSSSSPQPQSQSQSQSQPQVQPKSALEAAPFHLPSFVAQNRVSLKHYEAVRRDFHQHPDLSGREASTASRIVRHLHALGLPEPDIHTGIGGHGVAAVLRNGHGPSILLRSDSDALPVREATGLAYASTKRQADADGVEQPVMHACGHDVHMTCLLATAETLVNTRGAWAGTVILVFQPAEEKLAGAKAMVADGLYDKVPVPDVLLGQHVFPLRGGRVEVRAGPMMAASDSLKITFHGRGSHASQPQNSIDPIVMAAAAVGRLQTIVSREVSPLDTAVVTVGAMHGGEAENVIQDDAYIKVNVRTYKKAVRDAVMASIERIVKAEAKASGAVKEPEIELLGSGPATYNDPETVEVLKGPFAEHFGHDFNPDRDPIMGSEDFGDLATAIGKPSVFWIFGGFDPEEYDDAERRGKLAELPVNHSALFAPAMQPTLQTGIDAMVIGVMAFVGKQGKSC